MQMAGSGGSLQASTHPLPQNCISFVESIIGLVKSKAKKGNELTPVAFIGDFQSDTALAHVDLSCSSPLAHEQVRVLAMSQNADYVLTVMECWALTGEFAARTQEIVSQYGSIAASPFKEDCVHFRIETKDSLWVANALLTPAAGMKKRRHLGPVVFQPADAASSSFASYLQPSGSATVH